jgi:hypothetical protein
VTLRRLLRVAEALLPGLDRDLHAHRVADIAHRIAGRLVVGIQLLERVGRAGRELVGRALALQAHQPRDEGRLTGARGR